ncbi:MAG: TIGR02444 family protein, partial [Pseudomonadota bacterium]
MASSDDAALSVEPNPKAEAFWQWSLDFYAQEKVKDALLILQDRYGYNVNSVLWSLWAPQQNWYFDQAEAEEITSSITHFHRYSVERLRETRRYLTSAKHHFPKNEVEAYRKEVFALELKGEKLLQARLITASLDILGQRTSDNTQQEADPE